MTPVMCDVSAGSTTATRGLWGECGQKQRGLSHQQERHLNDRDTGKVFKVLTEKEKRLGELSTPLCEGTRWSQVGKRRKVSLGDGCFGFLVSKSDFGGTIISTFTQQCPVLGIFTTAFISPSIYEHSL